MIGMGSNRDSFIFHIERRESCPYLLEQLLSMVCIIERHIFEVGGTPASSPVQSFWNSKLPKSRCLGRDTGEFHSWDPKSAHETAGPCWVEACSNLVTE